MRTNGTCTAQHLSWRIKRANSSWILKHKRIKLLFARQSDVKVINNKKKKKKKSTCRIVKVKRRISSYLGNWKKNPVKHESHGDTDCNWCSWYSHQWISTKTRGLRNKNRVDTIQTTVLLSSARILRRKQETWGHLQSLKLLGETIC